MNPVGLFSTSRNDYMDDDQRRKDEDQRRKDEFQRKGEDAQTNAEQVEEYQLELKERQNRVAEHFAKNGNKMAEAFRNRLNIPINKQLLSRPPPSTPYQMNQAGRYR